MHLSYRAGNSSLSFFRTPVKYEAGVRFVFLTVHFLYNATINILVCVKVFGIFFFFPLEGCGLSVNMFCMLVIKYVQNIIQTGSSLYTHQMIMFPCILIDNKVN